ncbi:zinc transport system substrate-binding protein [Halobiforma haloterrestris]|uniref:Zinc transport system substrate-binding protein n=1 Tax=Natronobacterium haloterrestre TaxID=148448 RepID=A0A1I1I998_NATHA|nr:zinc ABC transporter substrate-binding protein [Halobiforma haloterrestris]SFC32807.1 zinc transport system substrate-binding protein [Halobiforma haloterrestris]
MELPRRSLLRSGAGALALGTVAGCLSEPGDDETAGEREGYAAFFALWDWADEVSGDAMAFTNPVDVGEMGHGWEPPADLQRNIAGADAFVYLDTPEFSWAQSMADDLAADNTDVTVIDALEGVEGQLLPPGGNHDHDHDHEDEDEHDHEDEEDEHDHEEEDEHDHEDEEDEHDHEEEEDEHDHEDDDTAPEFYDPHVWTDPILAQEMVGTIAAELGEIDPDNAEVYEDNAAAYVERLENVHEQFENLVADADRDVAVFAGHDSFRYLEERYGFELHTPVGVSPNAAETQSDISESIAVVEEHDIDTILYDPFEAPSEDDLPQMVDLLLENTGADDYEPITSTEGTTAEWNDRGWGWVEQMEEVTIPGLRQALGAD